MPSAKFTESEGSRTVRVVSRKEEDQRGRSRPARLFRVGNRQTAAGWIYDKLDMFPHLRRHACGFLSFLRTTTSSFNEQERSLYDIMIDCMITDLLMIALQRFETQYRLNEYQRPSDSSGLGQHCSRHKISLVFPLALPGEPNPSPQALQP